MKTNKPSSSFNGLANATKQSITPSSSSAFTRVRLGLQLHDGTSHIVAACDCVSSLPERICAYIPAGTNHKTLRVDYFSPSDTRDNLRQFFSC